MSTTTLKLPFKRFVAQVSSAPARSKSSYLALMAENLEALKKCPWREAAAVPVSLTGHDFTASTQFSDAYDAFKLTGNYETANMTEIAYAGMAAYRFTIPASAISGSVAVDSVSLPISRDRFEKSGVHLAVALSVSATPSTDWATVRGSGDLAASAQLAQTEAANLMASAPGDGTVTFDLSGLSSGNPAAYLWVYVTLEDYADHWEMYNAKEKRLYAIEGSAMLSGDGAEVTFDGEVTADAGVMFLVEFSRRMWNDSTSHPGTFTIPYNENTCVRSLTVNRSDTESSYGTNQGVFPLWMVWEGMANTLMSRFRTGDGVVSNDVPQFVDSTNQTEKVMSAPFAKIYKTGSSRTDVFSLTYEIHPRMKVLATPWNMESTGIKIYMSEMNVGRPFADVLVWLKRNAAISTVTEANTRNFDFYSGLKTTCEGFELLGKLSNPETIFDLAHPLGRCSVATLFFVPRIVISAADVAEDTPTKWSTLTENGTVQFEIKLMGR